MCFKVLQPSQNNPAAFADWLTDADKYGQTQWLDDNTKSHVNKFTSKLDANAAMRRESSVNHMKNEPADPPGKKAGHPLAKVSLLNKTYFMVLLVSRKIGGENFLKVVQYFQNYYPQTFDASCSICSFLFGHITDGLKKWAGHDVSSTYIAREFFVGLCSDYDEKIVKRFQITKSNAAARNDAIDTDKFANSKQPNARKGQFGAGLAAGIAVTRKPDAAAKGAAVASRAKKLKANPPVPIWRIKPPEDRDKLEWKEKAYRKYLEHICDTNGTAIADTSNNKILFSAAAACQAASKEKDCVYTQHFKYFVGRGNNSNLVKQALKRRFWWTSGCRDEDEWEDFNFIWTQWRRKPIIK